MGVSKLDNDTNKVLGLLQQWDKGNSITRRNILRDFIRDNKNKTGPELEMEFAQAASLFFTRLTAWLRMTYLVGTCLTDQLQAIHVFIAASSGQRFISEFIEVGGVLTLLDLIGLKQAKEKDRLETVLILCVIADCGRKFKELICQSYGVRAACECLAKAKSDDVREAIKSLLTSLSKGNPKFLVQVYKGLIALLPCSSPKTQQIAAGSLRAMQASVPYVSPALVEPLLQLLRSLHLEVQYEAIELIKELVKYKELRRNILVGLVSLLKPSKVESADDPKILKDPIVAQHMRGPLQVYLQQSAAAKTIGILARESDETMEELIRLRVVCNLVVAMSYQEHADSQRQAAITLKLFCRKFKIVDEQVCDAMGESLYEQFMNSPETLHTVLTDIQNDVLRSNRLNIAQVITTHTE